MRIAIVGMGYRAATLFKLFQRVVPDVSLSVVVDPQPGKVKTLASNVGVDCGETVFLQSTFAELARNQSNSITSLSLGLNRASLYRATEQWATESRMIMPNLFHPVGAMR